MILSVIFVVIVLICFLCYLNLYLILIIMFEYVCEVLLKVGEGGKVLLLLNVYFWSIGIFIEGLLNNDDELFVIELVVMVI